MAKQVSWQVRLRLRLAGDHPGLTPEERPESDRRAGFGPAPGKSPVRARTGPVARAPRLPAQAHGSRRRMAHGSLRKRPTAPLQSPHGPLQRPQDPRTKPPGLLVRACPHSHGLCPQVYVPFGGNGHNGDVSHTSLSPLPSSDRADVAARLRDALLGASFTADGLLDLLGAPAYAALARSETVPALRATRGTHRWRRSYGCSPLQQPVPHARVADAPAGAGLSGERLADPGGRGV